ncbi:hypothetical protein [Burkholderia stabilis]|uniref:hypothetical protein n=1 Tax=Burkholderia stabilis TaxID=95485 RepID=UPI003B983FA5
MWTRLHPNRYRYHDRNTGLFIREDPIGLAESNVFIYAPASTIGIDPLGLMGYRVACALLDESGAVEGVAADSVCGHDISTDLPSARHSIDKSRKIMCAESARC